MNKIAELLEGRAGILRKLDPKVADKNNKMSNFVNFPDSAKFFTFEHIIDTASSVFGPFGGIYAKAFIQTDSKDTLYTKSADGHSFFHELHFKSRYMETVMASIREKTRYVAGYQGGTSRDGTTSVALVSSSIGKNMMMAMMAEETKRLTIPNTMTKYIIATIEEEGVGVIDNHKTLIYDADKAEYIGGGFQEAIDAIATTVDGDPLFVDAYTGLMEELSEAKIDLTQCVKVDVPTRIVGDNNIELELRKGLRLEASGVTDTTVSAMKNHRSHVFFLDGFVDDTTFSAFEESFRNWMYSLLTQEDVNGNCMYSKSNDNNLNYPVFFVNRASDKMIKLIESLGKIAKLRSVDGSIETIEPKFILLDSTEIYKPRYDVSLKVFRPLVLSLDGISRYVLGETKMERGHNVPANEVDVTSVFPKALGSEQINIPRVSFNASVDRFLEGNTVLEVTDDIHDLSDHLMTISFDGAIAFLLPENDKFLEEATVIREDIEAKMKNYSGGAIFDGDYEAILSLFNTTTITPIITSPSSDQYNLLYSVYEDAQGIFESVHVHGVMAGGNVTMLRYFNELRDNAMNRLELELKDAIEPTLLAKYLSFAKTMLASIYLGYAEVYGILLNTDINGALPFLEQLEVRTDNKESYNVVTGKWCTNILESTRTTSDVFRSALGILRDTMEIKRVEIDHERDLRELEVFEREAYYFHGNSIEEIKKAMKGWE